MSKNKNAPSKKATDLQWRQGVSLLTLAAVFFSLKLLDIIQKLSRVASEDRERLYLVMGIWSIGCVLLAALGLHKMDVRFVKKMMATRAYLFALIATLLIVATIVSIYSST